MKSFIEHFIADPCPNLYYTTTGRPYYIENGKFYGGTEDNDFEEVKEGELAPIEKLKNCKYLIVKGNHANYVNGVK